MSPERKKSSRIFVAIANFAPAALDSLLHQQTVVSFSFSLELCLFTINSERNREQPIAYSESSTLLAA